MFQLDKLLSAVLNRPSYQTMDILKPPIIQIGNRRYRKVDNIDSDIAVASTYQREQNIIPDTECYDISNQLEQLHFTVTENGVSYAMCVPNAYYKFIIGKNGEMRRRIEVETKTRIHVPKPGDQDGTIVISGHDKAMVASAKTRIDVIVSSQRHRQPFTHFLAFPLNDDLIQFNFSEFKLDILRKCHEDRGIDESIFQNPMKLHLTLGTLVLLNQAEIEEALAVLETCWEDVNKAGGGKGGVRVGVRGLEYMNDDPSDVDVLYAKVISIDSSQLLETISRRLVDRFTRSGIMESQYDSIKLHMTVMNSIRRDPASGVLVPGQDLKERQSFDVNRVLQTFGDYKFGDCLVPRVDLCQRYGTSCNGYYTVVSSVQL